MKEEKIIQVFRSAVGDVEMGGGVGESHQAQNFNIIIS
jgi:hypothetical protein